MDWDRVNAWTTTLYALIRTLHIAKAAKFGDLTDLKPTIDEARRWTPIPASYNSVLLSQPFGNGRVRFRRDPNTHFANVASRTIQMLIQDLVVILDAMMDDVLAARREKAGTFPQSKIEKLAKHLDRTKYDWARKGCLELVAARNVLTHSNGRWNAKTINIVSSFINPTPQVGDRLDIGFEMLFQYRKAMRTFLNEVKP